MTEDGSHMIMGGKLFVSPDAVRESISDTRSNIGDYPPLPLGLSPEGGGGGGGWAAERTELLARLDQLEKEAAQKN